MGNYIGDYIHAHAEKYKDYGTSLNTRTDAFKEAKDTLQGEHDALIKKIEELKTLSPQEINNLTQLVNGLLYDDPNSPASQKIRADMEKIISDKYENFRLAMTKDGRTNLGVTKRFVNQGTYFGKKQRKDLLKRLQLRLDNLVHSKAKNPDEIRENIQKMQQMIQDNIPGGIILTKARAEQINQALHLIGYDNSIVGNIFETFFAEAINRCRNIEDKTTEDLVENAEKDFQAAVIGQKRSGAEASPISSEYIHNEQGEQGCFTYSFQATQDKSDIQISYDDISIGASLKNYSFNNDDGIHTVSGTTMAVMLLTQSALFVNHYLNIVPKRIIEGGKESVISDPDLVQQAHKAMKSIIVLKSLTGINTQSEKSLPASLFVVNARRRSGLGHVHIFSMSDLIKKLGIQTKGLVNPENRGVEIKGYPSLVNDSSDSAKSAQDRITELIHSLHSHNISVTIPKTVIEK